MNEYVFGWFPIILSKVLNNINNWYFIRWKQEWNDEITLAWLRPRHLHQYFLRTSAALPAEWMFHSDVLLIFQFQLFVNKPLTPKRTPNHLSMSTQYRRNTWMWILNFFLGNHVKCIKFTHKQIFEFFSKIEDPFWTAHVCIVSVNKTSIEAHIGCTMENDWDRFGD